MHWARKNRLGVKCGWRTHNSLMQGAHGLKFQRLGTMILHLQAAVKAVLSRGMALACGSGITKGWHSCRTAERQR